MPGIMIKSIKEMLSPTTKMAADTSDVSTDDRDNNDCSQRDHTEEACTAPVDQQNVSMSYHVCGSNQSTVNENTACGVLIKEQNIREQHVHNAEPSDGVTFSTDKGVKPKIRISVPAENGKTIVQVECANNKMTRCCYEQDDGQGRSLGSTWIFENVVHGLIESIVSDGDFIEFIDKLNELYRCKLKKMHNQSCLVLEFLHDTEEDRSRMIQDQEKVETMFKNFLQGIGKDAPSCSLQVSTEPATDNISDAKERAEDKEDAAALPSQSLSEDAKKRKLHPRSSGEKSELKKRKLTQGSSKEKSQHYKSEPTESTSLTGLTDRQLQVQVGSTLAYHYNHDRLYGVQQGSILSVTLFSITINS
ncbi:uncharacterized protein LOC124257837 isoform X3 [Haliotis rubra]|uniref:uncharacterized protein LOC124257837 isoform X3 n=1 Tax=Haliotis rubra TaxID=36100 RepID=UPI001EE5D189|nr:uncharacterized protein LOC124257837 isoform X3 [Haliotis rubra]